MYKKLVGLCIPVLGSAIIIGAGFSAWVWNEITTTEAMKGTIGVTSDVHGLTATIYNPNTETNTLENIASQAEGIIAWRASDSIALTLDQGGVEDLTKVGVSSTTLTEGITSDPNHYYLAISFSDSVGLLDAFDIYDLTLNYEVTVASTNTSFDTYVTTLATNTAVTEGTTTLTEVTSEALPVHVFDVPLLWQYVFKPGNGTDYHTMYDALNGAEFTVTIDVDAVWTAKA